MSELILEKMKHAFAFLVENHGFQVMEESYSPSTFGDAVIVLQSKQFELRIIRDRGQFFIDIRSSQIIDDWHDLRRVLEFLNGSRSVFFAFELNQLKDILKTNYDKLQKFFRKENYSIMQKGLIQFEKAKALQMLGGFKHERD